MSGVREEREILIQSIPGYKRSCSDSGCVAFKDVCAGTIAAPAVKHVTVCKVYVLSQELMIFCHVFFLPSSFSVDLLSALKPCSIIVLENHRFNHAAQHQADITFCLQHCTAQSWSFCHFSHHLDICDACYR